MDWVHDRSQFGRMVEVQPTGTAQLTTSIRFMGDALAPAGVVVGHVVLIRQLVLEHRWILVVFRQNDDYSGE
jgi:hypothetical protein